MPIQKKTKTLYDQLGQFAEQLNAFLVGHQNVLQNVPEFVSLAKQDAATLDPEDASEHCQLRQLVYMRRVVETLPQVASSLRSLAALPEINAQRLSPRAKLARDPEGPTRVAKQGPGAGLVPMGDDKE